MPGHYRTNTTANPVVLRLAQMVKKAARAVLAIERKQLAEDAAFVAGLRADWDAEQQARLDRLSEGPEPG